ALASPFIAAGLASWIAYLLAIRQRRHEVLISEQSSAFKLLHGVLIDLVRFCDTEIEGGDFGASAENLDPSVPRSPLEHGARLRSVLDQAQVFLNTRALAELSALVGSVYGAASMELAAASNPDLNLRDPRIYESIRKQAERCSEILLKELGFPRP